MTMQDRTELIKECLKELTPAQQAVVLLDITHKAFVYASKEAIKPESLDITLAYKLEQRGKEVFATLSRTAKLIPA